MEGDLDDFESAKTEIKEENDDQDARLELYSVMEVGKYEGLVTLSECKTDPTKEEEVSNLKYNSELDPGRNESLPTVTSDPSCDKPPDPIEMVYIKTEPLGEQECAVIPGTVPDAPFPVGDSGKSQKKMGRKHWKYPPPDPLMSSTEIVEGRKTHCCALCPYKALQMSNLRVHLMTHTKERPFRCEQCSASYTRAFHLKSHLLSHSGKKPYLCSVCALTFSSSSNLRRHVSIHGEKHLKCKTCPFSCHSIDSLKVHQRRHTGVRPYKCGVCSKAFSDNSALWQHVQVHDGRKPFSCDICLCRFSRAAALKRHMTKHTGEKRFQCDSCGYRCALKRHLIAHMRRRHDGHRPFSCAHCQHKAATKKGLIRHLSRMHAQ